MCQCVYQTVLIVAAWAVSYHEFEKTKGLASVFQVISNMDFFDNEMTASGLAHLNQTSHLRLAFFLLTV